MGNRLRVVAMSYVTRRANWVFVFFGFIAIVFAVHLIHQRPAMRSVVPHYGYWTMSYLRLDQKSMQQQIEVASGTRDQKNISPQQWDWKVYGDAERLYISVGPQIPWDEIRRLKKLRQIDMQHYHSSDGDPSLTSELQQISRIPQLTYLALPPFKQLSAADAQLLKSLRELRWLDLRRAQLSDGLQSLPDFPHLETLIISSIQDLTDSAIKRLEQYPKLCTLVVHESAHDIVRWSQGKPAEVSVDYQRVELLRSLPSLTTLYVPGRERSAIEQFAKQALPDMQVYPTTIDESRAPVFFPLVIAMLLLATPVFHSMSGQFSRPEALLTPNHHAPHLLVGIALIAMVICVGALTLWYGGVNPLMGGCLAIAILSVYNILWYPSITRPVIVSLFPLSFMVAMLLVGWNPARLFVRELFLGELSVVVGVIGLCGLSLLITLLARGVNLHRYLTEAGQATSLIGYHDVRGNSSSPVNVYGSPQLGRLLIRWLYTPVQRFAESTASFHGDDVTVRRQLWLIPNPLNARFLMIYFAIIGIIIVTVQFFSFMSSEIDPAHAGLEPVLHLAMILFFVLLNGFLMMTSWSWRRDFLAYEFCRPMDRSTFIRDLFASVVQQMKPLALIPVAIIAPLVIVRHTASDAAVWIAIYIVVGASVVLYTWGFGLLMISFRNPLLVGSTGGLLFVFLALVFFIPIRFVFVTTNLALLAPSVALLIAAIVGVTGIIAVWAANWRWSRLELGLLARE